MPAGRLTGLQERVLIALAAIDPPWTLSGGGALVGFHTRHRETRDLDLFWQARTRLDDLGDDVVTVLRRAGLDVAVLQTAEAFVRLDVRDPTGSVLVDLVADPVPLAESPRREALGGISILVDTPHQILVNKLCALLSRSELRDLVDVQALLDAGGDLARALADCPRQDGGFSPLTLAWSLGGLAIRPLAARLGWPEQRTGELDRFREDLVARILTAARPDQADS